MHDQAGSIKIFQRKNETTIKEKQGSKDIEIKQSSQIYKLDRYLDEDGIVTDGERLDKSNLSNKYEHQIALRRIV